MRLVRLEKVQDRGFGQLEFAGMDAKSLQVLRNGKQVGIFYRGVCYAIFSRDDKFSRNYFLVQLHTSGRVKLKELARLFGLGYQQCSNIVVAFKSDGLAGIQDESHERIGTKRIITEKVGAFILEQKGLGKTYEEISQAVRFKFRKKVKAESIRVWMCREGKQEGVSKEPKQMQFEEDPEVQRADVLPEKEEWQWNKYAGSFILYSMIEKSGLINVFEKNLDQEEKKKGTRWDVRRVMLTLFFSHALRLRSVEQSKHLVVPDFAQIVGGDFFRLQWLRYAVDEIVKSANFEKAMNEYFRALMELTDFGDKLFYTDGHFSTYYGKRSVPKGYDPRRQMPMRGRNTVYLHNSQGENVYFFESPSNTSLSNDIDTLISDLEKLGINLEGKTMAFDRGGFSTKCFRKLKRKKIYFISYLKNRKTERQVELDKFTERAVETEDGDTIEYKVFEKEKRETKYGAVRIILFEDDGKQIPILCTNPYLKAEQAVYRLQRRWREENCFKYMIEHFGIDLLTTYKTEEAPDKVISRPHPQRTAINHSIAQKKSELVLLQSELAKKIQGRGERSDATIKDFLSRESSLDLAIKNTQVDLDYLQRQREATPTKEKKNLREDHVIIAQKRRLLINAVKALNYNVEKWLQRILKEFHFKGDETLSIIRNLFQQPGQVQNLSDRVRVKLNPLDVGSMEQTLNKVLEKLQQNNLLRLPDGRILEICQTR